MFLFASLTIMGMYHVITQQRLDIIQQSKKVYYYLYFSKYMITVRTFIRSQSCTAI